MRCILRDLANARPGRAEPSCRGVGAAAPQFRAPGERVGAIPYGHRLSADGRQVEVDSQKHAVSARARKLRVEGQALRIIGRRLLEEGNAPRKGKTLRVQVVARVVDA